MTTQPATRDFDLSDILSITTGCLVSDRHIDGVYDILNWMTGDNLFTHQLPRAGRACEEPLKQQHPQLANLTVPAMTADNETNRSIIDFWLTELRKLYGTTLPVTPLAVWHSMNPIQELVEMTENTVPIIAVQL